MDVEKFQLQVRRFLFGHCNRNSYRSHPPGQFTNKIEAVQYNSALAITGCIRGTSKQKLYSELGLVSLYDGRTYHRLLFSYKIINDLAPQYLKRFIPNKCYI